MKTRYPVLSFLYLFVLLFGGVGELLRMQQHQYALNRQLIKALEMGDTRQALTLLKTGADPNTRFSPPPAPTFSTLLRDIGHPEEPRSADSRTALMLACGMDYSFLPGVPKKQRNRPPDLKLIEAMLTHGADLQLKTDGRYAVLAGTVALNRPRVVELLLAHGADPNEREAGTGNTPLMWAAYSHSRAMVRLLLAHGADVNAQDDEGETALRCALGVYTGSDYGLMRFEIDKDIIRQLLAHGADPNWPNKLGFTPLTLARHLKRSDIVTLMQQDRK